MYSYFTSNEITPKGWILDQLRLQRDGLNGNLDKVWPDIRDSKWIGGDREGWERVPYWLDGFVPLAYLLDDEDMKARAKRYIDKILENQQPDGWICPNGKTPIERYDTWAVMLIAKVLVVYYECSNDERIPDAVYRILKNYYELLSSGKIKLFAWAEHRWFEGFVALQWIKDRYGEEAWMVALGKLLFEQGTDYSRLTEKWESPKYGWSQDTHVVNLAMMLKSEAMVSRFFGTEYTDLAESLFSKLRKFNGTAMGMFTGDECLDGISPIAGTELCSVVELMYTFELLYLITADNKWAERLEMLSYNALPAAISDDMWTHQYVQMSNQIACIPLSGKPVFGTNSGEAHVFGLEPHFGCCTSNFGQGWPKLVLSAFMRNDEEIVGSMLIPSRLTTEWKGVPVSIELDTQYPFKNRLVYTISAKEKTDMSFKIRVPSFAKNLRVNGKRVKNSGFIKADGFEAGDTVIEVTFDTEAKMISAPTRGLYSIKCGSLLFSANIGAEYRKREYTRDGVERKYPYCDYNIRPVSDWNLAFASKQLSVNRNEVDSIPFSSKNPPVTVEAQMCHVDWGYEFGYSTVCSRKPKSKKALDEPFALRLYPYACAKLRMTEMPIASYDEKNKAPIYGAKL